MPKLAALFSPERAADVVDAATRQLLEDRFEVVWATSEHAAGPGSAAKPPALDPAAVPELVKGADVLLTSWGTPHLGKELWSDGNGPKVVAHAAGTVKNLIDPAILDQGVAVFSAGPRIAWSVGEYCLASMLTLARRLPRFDGAVRAGGWKQTEYRGHELAGAKVGIIGASSTARALITLLKPFGCDLAVYDPYLSDERAAELGVRPAALEDAASGPFLSIHVPNVPETKGMITRALIENLPDGAVVVNSSRGPAIDQEALLEHALDGRIYAALDVYDPEPPKFDEKVLSAQNLLLTPHIAGDTAEGHLALAGYVLKDALQWLDDGTRGPSFVDPASWSIAA
ncbi:phosphoglycerate dehydrogenase-like enzyme [Kribbella rubisoli]|uniref:Phosphoglycerate dehydrogenase-like enzyme n=1 Tax=Kribbella rubisoli TaxID=3075929 RepID=A0A4Q7WLB1_9ACTN|nr:hydroxyacid dehydrogenase [Kribbella rubisoli]RZU10493.1 phosphoglycerate dehydrogenase-like enzyme [Kribbella rubisoli]